MKKQVKRLKLKSGLSLALALFVGISMMGTSPVLAFNFGEIFGLGGQEGDEQAGSDYEIPEGESGIEINVPREEDVEKGTKLKTVLELIYQNYYREPERAELLEAMAIGLANSMESPWTYYLTPEQHKQVEEDMSGEYVGIGVSVSKRPEGFVLLEPIPDGPADQAGIMTGDIVQEVDGEAVQELPSAQELANLVRGEAGTEVHIKVYRPSESQTLEFTIKRAKVETVLVRTQKIDENTGVIAIREFAHTLPNQFQKALKSLTDEGVKNIVFDMRNNPGGGAIELRTVLDFLLDEGPITGIYGRENAKSYVEKWRTSNGKIASDLTFAILVNRNTASAAELFSGALRDRLNVPLIGETTYGKGSGGVTYTLNDHSGLNVTIFRYILPKGEALEGVGLQPTIEVSLDASVANKTISDLTLEEDAQLQAALTYFERHPVQKDDTTEVEPKGDPTKLKDFQNETQASSGTEETGQVTQGAKEQDRDASENSAASQSEHSQALPSSDADTDDDDSSAVDTNSHLPNLPKDEGKTLDQRRVQLALSVLQYVWRWI